MCVSRRVTIVSHKRTAEVDLGEICKNKEPRSAGLKPAVAAAEVRGATDMCLDKVDEKWQNSAAQYCFCAGSRSKYARSKLYIRARTKNVAVEKSSIGETSALRTHA